MAQSIKSELVAEAIDAIINARDFCGDERQAVFELAMEHKLSRAQFNALYRSANSHANAKWNEYQKSAGVNPKYTW